MNDKIEKFIEEMDKIYSFSFMDKKNLIKCAVDLCQWQESPITELWDDFVVGKSTDSVAKKKVLADFFTKYERIKNSLKDYSDFSCSNFTKRELAFDDRVLPKTILGKCPVASEKTRCCNLDTLDIVAQCGFSCSYCSIQPFYNTEKIVFPLDLEKRLSELEKNLDKNLLYHIGTGQSSDSLMWGDRNSILQSLFNFAERNPNVILELKTKSSNIEYLLKNRIPKNVITTWSLNTQTIIDCEEHLTSSLLDRLKSAKLIHNKGNLVGFHFHPIIYYKGWEDGYKFITSYIQEQFNPRFVAMVSLGTLTFIKPVMKKIRDAMYSTKILQMDLTESEGKFSYPLCIKENIFKTIYDYFSDDWKKATFFYMCMENISLWKTVFNFEYGSNREFEAEMKKSYIEKINSI